MSRTHSLLTVRRIFSHDADEYDQIIQERMSELTPDMKRYILCASKHPKKTSAILRDAKLGRKAFTNFEWFLLSDYVATGMDHTWDSGVKLTMLGLDVKYELLGDRGRLHHAYLSFKHKKVKVGFNYRHIYRDGGSVEYRVLKVNERDYDVLYSNGQCSKISFGCEVNLNSEVFYIPKPAPTQPLRGLFASVFHYDNGERYFT